MYASNCFLLSVKERHMEGKINALCFWLETNSNFGYGYKVDILNKVMKQTIS